MPDSEHRTCRFARITQQVGLLRVAKSGISFAHQAAQQSKWTTTGSFVAGKHFTEGQWTGLKDLDFHGQAGTRIGSIRRRLRCNFRPWQHNWSWALNVIPNIFWHMATEVSRQYKYAIFTPVKQRFTRNLPISSANLARKFTRKIKLQKFSSRCRAK